MIVMSPFLSSAIILIAGVLTIYLTVGTQVLPEQGGMQAGWLATLVRGADVDGFMFRAAGGQSPRPSAVVEGGEAWVLGVPA